MPIHYSATVAVSHLGWIVAGALAFAWLVAIVRARLRRWARTRRVRRAVRGETDAERLLEGAGYAIEERQPGLEWSVACDGVMVPISLRADLVVTRDGRRYVAEVKTGERAPRIETAATRRQLLEYAVAYEVDGALLVDMEARTVTRVEFPGL